jgi:ATP-dependent DNA helicase RecG
MTSEPAQLLRAGESETVEFKQSTGEMREIVETVGAFANTRGGTILVGVTNAGEVRGVTVGKGTLEALTNAIYQQTDPKVFPSLTLADEHGKTVLVLRVEESPIKPVLVHGRGLKRVGRSNHVLSSNELTRLFFESERMSWDAGPIPDATMDAVGADVLEQFVRRARQERNMALESAVTMPQVLEKLGLLHHGRLSRAALLLFGTHPQRFFVQSEVRCARFKGTRPLHFLDMKVIEGNIIDQVPAALEFIQRHIRMEAEITPAHIERQERWEYPLDALREALVNALCHRDYRDSGNVQVRIFDDRLEIWSPGALPEGVTIADLSRTHNSHPRNQRIARAFFLIGYIEQWGTGTLRMRELCQEAGLPLPEFIEINNAFTVTFRTSKLTEEYLAGLGLHHRQRAAVDYLRTHGQITKRAYVTLTGVSARTATADLHDLVSKGVLTPVGKGRSFYYQLQNGG